MNTRMRRPAPALIPGLATIVLAATAPLAAQGTSSSRPSTPRDAAKQFDAYVAKGAHDWHVPGMVVAVVKGDSVLLQKAYGVQDVKSGAPVDIHTRFAIGSTTKAMTAMSLGMLVDEGKLSWNDRVIDHLPGFQLYDPYVTRDLRIRDLLTHRSGLGGEGDLLWSIPGLSEADIVKRMRYIHPESPLRTRFSYNNLMYEVAGDVIAAVSGMSWEQFVTERIFKPLGMNETIPTVAGTAGQSNVATPHRLVGDSLEVIPRRSTDGVKAAGSVYSSIADMTHWVQFLLDSGRVNGRRLVSDSVFREIFTPQIMADRGLYPALTISQPHFFTYGLGIFLQDYAGHELAMHTGSIDGMCAIIGLVPDQRLGVYVLENVDHAELRHALMYKAVDLWLGTGTRDWSTDLHTFFAQERDKALAKRSAQAASETSGPASLPLTQYVGTYRDSAFGDVTISMAGSGLRASYRTAAASLVHERFDAFRGQGAKPNDLDSVAVTFTPDGTGGVRALRAFGITFAKAATTP
jgi:CubicO group peptidase (beta-lactamase class C family)